MMDSKKMRAILPAFPLAIALAFAPAAFAQSGHAVPTAPVDSSTVPLDTAQNDADKKEAKREIQADVRKGEAKASGAVRQDPAKRSVKKKSTMATTPDSHAGHAGQGDHAVDSVPKDTTLILGTPGSPTTRGVPGTQIKGEKK